MLDTSTLNPLADYMTLTYLASFYLRKFLQACMAGIVFAKFTKPTMRAETILFSKNALVTLRQEQIFIKTEIIRKLHFYRNGSLYLVCRIADLR